MREIYNEYFHIPKEGKIREKVIITRMMLTVTVIISCLIIMGVSAYAYFSHSVVSASNVIQSASFEANVSIVVSDKNNEAVEVKRINGKTQAAVLYAGNTYSITVEKAGNASTGFCVITADGCEISKYHTQQIGVDVNSGGTAKQSITFTLTVTRTTTVEFCAHWGTSSHYADYTNKGTDNELYIVDGEHVTLNIADNNQTQGSDETTAMLSETDLVTEAEPTESAS